mmetsp:Transcript_17070/g.16759  ORF Transcript_17070/g.16759 Transcript_17070/m.16759 type:complete len:205 (-) Transcript_17070:8-622(-)
METKGIMDLINKQQSQLSSLIKQSRMENESKLVYENIQLSQRLKMLEEASQKRKESAEGHKSKKKHKKRKKHKKYKGFPMMYGGLPPMPPPMYGVMPPQALGPMGYPGYYQGGMGEHPGYSNNMSGLAGAGYQALHSPNSYYGYDNQNNTEIPKRSAEFEDKYKIVTGADINESNKEELKNILSKQLGGANLNSHRERPPSNNN